jgi:hypothetical protein
VNGSPTIVTSGTEYQSNYGQGGLVWTKQRTGGSNEHHWLLDTERTAQHTLSTNLDSAQINQPTSATFNSTGYQINNWTYQNDNNEDYVGWTFRKAPKFFDIVTWTGNGTENRQIAHNLGSAPGMILVKGYSLVEDWNIYHRSRGNAKYIQLNGDANEADATDTGPGSADLWFETDPTSTHFTIGDHNRVNKNGDTYVAYLFAHNNNDGNFGPDGDQDIIKCGGYTGNNSATGPNINLGFEPQWVFIRHVDANGNSSLIFDNERGVYTDRADASLSPSANNDEQDSANSLEFNSTGFQLTRADGSVNGSGKNYIYVAIRRGPIATPTNANEVFGTSTRLAGTLDVRAHAGFTVDGYLRRNDINSSDLFSMGARLTGGGISIDNSAEFDLSGANWYDQQNGIFNGTGSGAAEETDLYLMWKRAPGYYDQVCYDGNGSGRTIAHNLGVVPEMIWVKMRTGGSGRWVVYNKTIGRTKYMFLNETDAATTYNAWNNTAPTSSVFSVSSWGDVNQSGHTFVAHLFASVDGVSKVGSYSGNGGTQNIDCGFSSSARMVLIKRYQADPAGWIIFDSERGIVAGNDPNLFLHNSNAQGTSYDLIDPYASGFHIPTGDATINAVGSDYIFYAIA